MNEEFSPDDNVLSCEFIERGLSFQLEGITACCESTMQSPPLLTPEEINAGKISYELIVERRKKLFYAINGKGDFDPGMCKTCSRKYRAKFKDISFEFIGKIPVMNIQHYTTCNMRCKYCCYAQSGRLIPEKYSTNSIIKAIEAFREKGKCLNDIWCTFSGGEPTLLADSDKFIEYFFQNNLGGMSLFSNALKYSPAVAKRLDSNQIFLTTSLDAGIPSTFTKMRGVNALQKVVDNLILYRKTNTKNIWLKYIVTENNCGEDDMFSFIFLMLALQPDKIYIAVDFPYGDKEIDDSLAVFAGKLWYNLKKYGDFNLQYYSDVNSADPKFKRFYDQMMDQFHALCEEAPLSKKFLLNRNNSNIQNIQALYDKIMSQFMSTESTTVSGKFVASKREYEEFIDIDIYPEERGRERETCIPQDIVKRFVNLQQYFIPKIVDKIYCRLSHASFIRYVIARSLLFDTEYYLSQFENVIISDPIKHYCEIGFKLGKNPNQWFNGDIYVKNNPDVEGKNPFYHFLRYGIYEGRVIT